jgi:hypothetical protein
MPLSLLLMPWVIELHVCWCGVRRSSHRSCLHQRQILVVEGYFTRGRRAVVIMLKFYLVRTFPRGRPSLRGVWYRARRQHALEIVIGDRQRRREWGPMCMGGAATSMAAQLLLAGLPCSGRRREGTVTQQQGGHVVSVDVRIDSA